MLPNLNSPASKTQVLAVSVEEAALQCRISKDELDDDTIALLTNCILSSQAYLEGKYSVYFGVGEFKSYYIYEGLPIKTLHFPISNVQKVNSVSSVNDALDIPYIFYASPTHAVLTLPQAKEEDVFVIYTAGFTTSDSVPQEVKQAVLMLTAYYYDQRNPETSNNVNISTFAVDALMLPYKKLL